MTERPICYKTAPSPANNRTASNRMNPSIGIDFGTTNTVLAFRAAGGGVLRTSGMGSGTFPLSAPS